ncbi:G-type lectin S-receptor-like serine/threonine-protein kinase At1g61500 [Linum perenne]
MLNNSSNRKSFIQTTIQTARRHGFGGMDFSWSKDSPNDLANIGTLFKEWRAGINSEVRTAGERKLLLTAALDYAPGMGVRNFPVGSIRKHLDWVHVMAQNLESSEVMEPDAPLNDPEFLSATRSGIDAWISVGKVDPGKLVLSLPLYGFAWKLANPEEENYIGARVSGPAVNEEGVNGSVSVIFDGPEAIRAKVSYTTEMELGGYYVWQIPYDYNGELALLAAQEQSKKQRQLKRREGVLAGTISVAAFLTIILSIAAFYWIRINGLGIFKVLLLRGSVSSLRVEDIEGSGDFGKNDTVPNLRVYSFEEINKATNRFSLQNKLGRGGYGPVYKGVLPDGQEIAVKKLSETSTQGLHEFKNEVQLNARIQHVNLVRVHSAKRNILDWSRRVEIIQGITQGLVYLQEYSRLPIIHRDLKASNILLDSDFLPKISDFGIAKVFSKNGQETNTVRIVGTIFGVLLLQIITSKKVARIYGPAGDSSLQEYAFELWEDGRGMEIVEPSLDDTSSSCKLLTCLRIALLCVQDDPIDRPSMLQVASMLRNETVVGSLFPKRPTFSFRKQQQQQQGDNNNITEPAVFQPEFCSIADATITQLDGR